eukprot:m.571279 g.571279  ORF g.571279 m.571279 type:complete len:109 (+) comp57856_c0_seq9:172-498(+)
MTSVKELQLDAAETTTEEVDALVEEALADMDAVEDGTLIAESSRAEGLDADLAALGSLLGEDRAAKLHSLFSSAQSTEFGSIPCNFLEIPSFAAIVFSHPVSGLQCGH